MKKSLKFKKDPETNSFKHHPSTVVFPFYIYPDFGSSVSAWQTLYESALDNSLQFIVIINPNDGPGFKLNLEYQLGCEKLNNFVKLFGYVSTTYGTRDMQEVIEDIERWVVWYSISGLFLDEVTSHKQDLTYYRRLCSFIYSKYGKLFQIMLNPGRVPHEDYFRLCNYIVTFENFYSNWNKENLYQYDGSTIKHHHFSEELNTDFECCTQVALIHSCPSEFVMKKALKLCKVRKLRAIFITNEKMPNPWNKIPKYWPQFLYNLKMQQ
ncbi:uncharacterized protein LOC135119547 [Zophobas morio]|jgi:hypothetical protein|uniref:uncharacterized protein LOC135119547 n=1 Tax=Zophobas morio TaxID=2755281 RepID=UPI003083C472